MADTTIKELQALRERFSLRKIGYCQTHTLPPGVVESLKSDIDLLCDAMEAILDYLILRQAR